jgi:(1->4)-alpha-D-glucan 1-alpha-D-glucosylmutase
MAISPTCTPASVRDSGFTVRGRRIADIGAGLVKSLLTNPTDPQIKLFTTHRALTMRRAYREVFEVGDYSPLSVGGERREHVLAFARRSGSSALVVIVPRLLTSILKPGQIPCGREVWLDTTVELPDTDTTTWLNAFSSEPLASSRQLSLAEAFRNFPMALLHSYIPLS